MLVGTGKLVEQGGLAAVLIAGQRKRQGRAVRQGMLALFDVVLAALTQTRVVHHLIIHQSGGRRDLFGGDDADLCGVIQAQGQLIAVDAQLHGVAHGGQLDQGDLCPRNKAHIQKMLPQGPGAAHRVHHRALADLQFFQCHISCSFERKMLAFANNSNIG